MNLLSLLGGILTPEASNPDYIAPSSVHAYSPDDALSDLNKAKGTSYKSVQEAMDAGEPISNKTYYHNNKGEDITDQFTSNKNVPEKIPGVWQRLLNPAAAQRETDINTAYNLNKESPYLSNLSNLNIGAGNIDLGRKAGTNISSASPLFVSALTGGSGTANAQEGVQSALSDLNKNVPELSSTARATELGQQPAITTEANRRYLAGTPLFNTELTNQMKNASQIVPAEQELRGFELNGANERQPIINELLKDQAATEMLKAKTGLDLSPTSNAIIKNEALGELYRSQYSEPNPPYANRVNADGTITPNVSTGSLPNSLLMMRMLSNPDLMKSIQGGTPTGTIVSKSGKKIPQPPSGLNNSIKLPNKSLPTSMQQPTFNQDGSIMIGGKKYIPAQ